MSHRAQKIGLRLPGALLMLSLMRTPSLLWAEPLIDYHQHLLMPNDSSAKQWLASDVVKALDAAHIQRALVLSMAYRYGNPNNPPVSDEYQHVKAENDWVSTQVGKYRSRLRGFCGVDPLKDYAVEEIARCARDENLRSGLKLHFGNSDVDLNNAEHITKLQEVFQTASVHHMAITVHMHSSITRHRPYGSKEAQRFLDLVIPAANGAYIQIAHFAGSGGFDDPGTEAALQVFIEAIQKGDARMKHIYFDITSVAGLGNWESKKDLIVNRARQLGIHRILFGSDGNFGEGVSPVRAWSDFRKLPFSELEVKTIEQNVTPYVR